MKRILGYPTITMFLVLIITSCASTIKTTGIIQYKHNSDFAKSTPPQRRRQQTVPPAVMGNVIKSFRNSFVKKPI
jgi:hypothetical protein